MNLDDDECSSLEVEPTPLPPKSSRPVRGRRRARRETDSSCSSDEDETLQETVVPTAILSVRSHRASKSAALSKLASTNKPVKIDDEDEDEDDEESEVTSEDDEDVVC